jgi:hypothetical protein
VSKQISNIFSVILGIAIIFILLYSLMQKHDPISIIKGNTEQRPLVFILKDTNDIVCKMLIRSYTNSAQIVDEKGNTHFFNDPGCMILWFHEQSNKKYMKLWVYSLDTKRWINARFAWYGVRDKTIMGYGFGAREKKKEGAIGFQEMYHRMIHDETLLDPKIRKSLLEDSYQK